jgi:hypothetical protein
MDYSKIKGFNYQPSYGSSGFELWQKFDAKTIEEELGRGKKYFPGMNAIRLWLSWDSFIRSPDLFAERFEIALQKADGSDLLVMPVLFNRWHSGELDYGGIYIDHFLPRASWVQRERMFDPFMETVVGRHAADDRILAWDLCNEPFAYSCPREQIPEIAQAETAWLRDLYHQCKQLGAEAPITIGFHSGIRGEWLRELEPICDIISIHPYWTCDSPPHDKGAYEKQLDEYVEYSRSIGKTLLATETCWGHLDDATRVEIIKYTLDQLKKREIGWLVYLLHHSLIADAHRPEFGPLGRPGNLSFIEADGSLRPGHEIYNDF